MTQIKIACSIADAMSYLHSKKIVFRDLKPANVGFDSSGVLKLFDFEFAIGVDEPPKSPSMCSGNSEITEELHLLYDRCGTPRCSTGGGARIGVQPLGRGIWPISKLR